MPNIIYLWDFEDGTTQGWQLNEASLDNSGALQGTYSIAVNSYHKDYAGSGTRDVKRAVGSISGIDLSQVDRPILLMLIKAYGGTGETLYANQSVRHTHRITVTVSDEAGNPILSKTVDVLNVTLAGMGKSITKIKVVALDLSPCKGMTNLTISIEYNYSISSGSDYEATEKGYIDMIAIVDGGDYIYDIGAIANDGEDKTIDIDIPDYDLSQLSATVHAVALATPDWDASLIEATSQTDLDSVTVSSDGADNKYTNLVQLSSGTYSSFRKLSLHIKVSIGTYFGTEETFVVAFLDASFNYVAIYVINVYFTFNPVATPFASSVVKAMSGETTVGETTKTTLKLHGKSPRVKITVTVLEGDATGTLTLHVLDSQGNEIGTATVDLSQTNESSEIQIPSDTDVQIYVSYTLTATRTSRLKIEVLGVVP